MRKFKKRELCDCLYTLKEANRKMNIATEEVRTEMLPQCQEMAIAVGTAIEQSEGEGTKAVSYLEEYCEELYLASGAQDQTSWKSISKKMDKLLNSIQNSIRYDLPDSPCEIVFMPYKASMWDALDSVYRAALQEENCHVVVMPIPYFNINRKDQRMDLHYEGDLFPTDIPITDYQMYDLAKERPDVIFIHNPYDGQNFVTQVPEEYFSSKLVEYTEHLVYIPYFITKGDKVKDIYCVMPAVQNAWKTFVQSEAVRKEYLKNGADANKIVAMGSPKFDMVIRLQQNPPEVPETWKDALSGRKVFLLNTHLNPIINETEKLIDKLHQIFELFRQKKESALLWRPHPLSIETAKAMNPKILGRYLGLIEEFKTLSNGVYDDSSDVHRAMAVSDAYVGDWSSLVTLYGITGKPMYRLNIQLDSNIKLTEKHYAFHFACSVQAHGVLWAPAENDNGLYKVDISTHKAELVTRFDKEERCGRELYRNIIYYKEKLYLIPSRAKSIAIYDMITGEKKYVKLDYSPDNNQIKFVDSIVYNNFIYLFPGFVSRIVKYNMDDEHIEYLFGEICRPDKENAKKAIFLYGLADNNEMWIGSCRDNSLYQFNLSQDCYNQYFIEQGKEAFFVDVAKSENKLYLLSVLGEVFEWDIEKKNANLIWRFEEAADGQSFWRIVWNRGCLWLLPGRAKNIVKIDLSENYNAQEIMYPVDFLFEYAQRSRFDNYVLREDKIYIYPSNGNMFLKLDCVSDTISGEKVLYDTDAYNQRVESKVKGEDGISQSTFYLYDENICPLEYFVDRVIEEKETYGFERAEAFKHLQKNIDGNSGEKIWNYIYREIL